MNGAFAETLRAFPAPLAGELRAGLARVEREIERLLATSDPLIAPAVGAVVSRPGKRLRPLLAVLGAMAVHGRISDGAVVRGAAAVEVLHLASLVHDDVIDESRLRSGEPTPNAVLGNGRAVLLGDFLFARAMLGAGRIGRALFLRFVAVAEALVSGEFGQAAMAGMIPPLARYLGWIEAKTARLFALAASPGREAVPPLERYGHAFGMAYQLRDDLLDLIAEDGALGKPVMSDCRRGIYTYPIIAACARAPELATIVTRRGRDDPAWHRELRAFLHRTGAVEEAEEACRDWAMRACTHLADLPYTPAREALAALAEWAATIPRRDENGQGDGGLS